MSTALITGPTAGIGKSIAYQLAEKGYDLFLVARREDRLQVLKSDIENKFQVRVHYLKSDLTSPDAPQEIYDYGKSMNLDISTLILNAGYQINTKLEDASLQEEEDCLQSTRSFCYHAVKTIHKRSYVQRGWPYYGC